MKRRQLIAGLGAIAASGGLVVGSGAFSNVEASRTVTVSVADDNEALLALEQLGESVDGIAGRSNEGGTPETVSFSFPGRDRRVNDQDLGLGTDSVYEFDQDSGEADDTDPTKGLLRITNRGTQTVEVYSRHETGSELDIELFDVTDSDRTALRDEPAVLDVGEHVDVGFRISTFGTDLGEYDETLTIIGEAPDE